MFPDPTFGSWLALAGLAGLVALDDTSWPQAMVSRPVVAATIGGWLGGDPEAGVAVGAVLELLLLPHQPLGGARCPDPGPASLVAGAAGAVGGGAPSAVLAASLIGWVLSWAGEVTVRWQRRLAAQLFGEAAATVREAATVERRQWVSAAADFLRGSLLGVVWWIPCALLVRALTGDPSGASTPGLLAAAVALGTAGSAVAGSTAGRGVVRVAAPIGAAIAAGWVWWLA